MSVNAFAAICFRCKKRVEPGEGSVIGGKTDACDAGSWTVTHNSCTPVAIPVEPKKNYVRQRLRSDPGAHHCHWPDCNQRVPAATWGCRRHWMMLPKYLRDRVWLAFRPGQEETKTPSRAYVAVAKDVQDWINITRHLHFQL